MQLDKERKSLSERIRPMMSLLNAEDHSIDRDAGCILFLFSVIRYKKGFKGRWDVQNYEYKLPKSILIDGLDPCGYEWLISWDESVVYRD